MTTPTPLTGFEFRTNSKDNTLMVAFIREPIEPLYIAAADLTTKAEQFKQNRPADAALMLRAAAAVAQGPTPVMA